MSRRAGRRAWVSPGFPGDRWLLLGVVGLATAAVFVGPTGVAGPEVWAMRLPRVVGAVGGGAALAGGGVAMQTVLRNPLADPFILGMSGGAALGAVLASVGAVPVAPAVAAAGGAWGAALLVGALARGFGEGSGGEPQAGGGGPERLLLVGVAVSVLAGALTTLVLQLAPDTSGIRAALYWTSGGLGAATWTGALPPLLAALALGLVARRHASDLDALLLGDDTARSLGVPVPALRLALIGGASLLTGLVVALAGAVGFCGLVAPHLARRLQGAGHAALVPVAMSLGAGLLLVADTAARTVAAPRELPVGAITALVGAPWLLTLLRRPRW